MSDLSIELYWQRDAAELTPGGYSNAHTVRFDDRHSLAVDAAPDWGGDPTRTNPEQALVSALSSCHMMTFLALAAKAGWPVASYRDRAVAYLGKNGRGRMAVVRMALHPAVGFDAGFEIEADAFDAMQQRAHRYCFVANSLDAGVQIDILSTRTTEDTDVTERYPAA